MGELATKYLPVLVRKSWRYIARKKRVRSAEYERAKRRRSLQLTLFIAICFAGLCLYAFLSPVFMRQSTPGQSHATSSTSSNTNAQLTRINAIVNEAEKRLTLSNSANASLTAYSHKKSATLSSSSLDEQLKNQVDAHGTGKGGVALNADSAPTGTFNGCTPNSGNSGSYGIVTTPDFSTYLGCDASVGPDFLIGKQNGVWSGSLFNLDTDLTLQNPVVQGFVTAMQAVSILLFAPLIALIGVQIATGSLSLRRANALESLPRLLFGIAGSAVSLLVAGAFLDFVDSLILGTVNEAIAIWPQGLGQVDLTSMVYPAYTWGDWILGLVTLLVTLTVILPIVAQIEILGTSIGAWVSVGLAFVLLFVLYANMHNYLQNAFSMILGAQVFVRLLMIDFYVILSPVAMIAAALPGRSGVNFTRDWMMGFGSLALSQFAQVLILLIGIAVTGQYVSNVTGPNTVTPGLDIVKNLMEIGTLILMIRIPTLFKSNATSLITQVGTTVGGSVAGEYTQGLM